MMTEIQREFEGRLNSFPKTTTSPLLGILFAYARGSKHITEIGVADPFTTYALLLALEDRDEKDRKLVSMDIANAYPENVKKIERIAGQSGIAFEYIIADSKEIDIEPTDFLFIDSEHTRGHLLAELNRHSDKVRSMISFHDTSEPFHLLNVVLEWLDTTPGKDWELFRHFELSHGFTVIRRRVK